MCKSSALQSDCQKVAVNVVPLSDTMSVGKPCLLNTFFIKCFASIAAVSLDLQGVNMTCLVSRHTTTIIALHSFDLGRATMWSTEIELRGLSPRGKGFSSPNCFYKLVLTVCRYGSSGHIVQYCFLVLAKNMHVKLVGLFF